MQEVSALWKSRRVEAETFPMSNMHKACQQYLKKFAARGLEKADWPSSLSEEG